MVAYQLVLVVKFLSVLGYAGGLVAAFLASDPEVRKRAVHKVASPSLLVIWLTGYTLLLMSGVSLVELWAVGGLVLSLLANGALVFCVTRERRSAGAFACCAVPLACAVMVMVFKPTWAGTLP